jgi:hypothetical protein
MAVALFFSLLLTLMASGLCRANGECESDSSANSPTFHTIVDGELMYDYCYISGQTVSIKQHEFDFFVYSVWGDGDLDEIMSDAADVWNGDPYSPRINMVMNAVGEHDFHAFFWVDPLVDPAPPGGIPADATTTASTWLDYERGTTSLNYARVVFNFAYMCFLAECDGPDDHCDDPPPPDPPMPRRILLNAAIHELGHVLGLGHTIPGRVGRSNAPSAPAPRGFLCCASEYQPSIRPRARRFAHPVPRGAFPRARSAPDGRSGGRLRPSPH